MGVPLGVKHSLSGRYNLGVKHPYVDVCHNLSICFWAYIVFNSGETQSNKNKLFMIKIHAIFFIIV